MDGEVQSVEDSVTFIVNQNKCNVAQDCVLRTQYPLSQHIPDLFLWIYVERARKSLKWWLTLNNRPTEKIRKSSHLASFGQNESAQCKSINMKLSLLKYIEMTRCDMSV